MLYSHLLFWCFLFLLGTLNNCQSKVWENEREPCINLQISKSVLPFLPQSWKWKMILISFKLILEMQAFSTSMKGRGELLAAFRVAAAVPQSVATAILEHREALLRACRSLDIEGSGQLPAQEKGAVENCHPMLKSWGGWVWANKKVGRFFLKEIFTRKLIEDWRLNMFLKLSPLIYRLSSIWMLGVLKIMQDG